MSSSNVSSAAIDVARETKVWFAKYWLISLIILGTIGHTLNIFIFTGSKFRSIACVRYFLAATLSGIFVTCVSAPARLLQNGYNIDVLGYSTAQCKIVSFLLLWASYVECSFGNPSSLLSLFL